MEVSLTISSRYLSLKLRLLPSVGWLGDPLEMGGEASSLRRAQSRTASPPQQVEPVEVAWASRPDASWTSPWGSNPGMWVNAPGKT